MLYSGHLSLLHSWPAVSIKAETIRTVSLYTSWVFGFSTMRRAPRICIICAIGEAVYEHVYQKKPPSDDIRRVLAVEDWSAKTEDEMVGGSMDLSKGRRRMQQSLCQRRMS